MAPSPFPFYDQLCNPEELAAHWSVSRQHIYDLMDEGLPSLHIGASRRIRLGEAIAWLEDQQPRWSAQYGRSSNRGRTNGSAAPDPHPDHAPRSGGGVPG